MWMMPQIWQPVVTFQMRNGCRSRHDAEEEARRDMRDGHVHDREQECRSRDVDCRPRIRKPAVE